MPLRPQSHRVDALLRVVDAVVEIPQPEPPRDRVDLLLAAARPRAPGTLAREHLDVDKLHLAPKARATERLHLAVRAGDTGDERVQARHEHQRVLDPEQRELRAHRRLHAPNPLHEVAVHRDDAVRSQLVDGELQAAKGILAAGHPHQKALLRVERIPAWDDRAVDLGG